MTLPVCVDSRSAGELEIEEIEALETWSGAGLTWKVTWPTPKKPVEVGAGYGRPPSEFVDLPSRGTPGPCPNDGSPVFAVEFPRAVDHHIGFDAVRVRYSLDAEEYESEYEVTLGICAESAPAGSDHCN